MSLEERFERLSMLLYDTRVSVEVLEREVFPFLAPNVGFVDPWQSGGGFDTYRLGAAGFHCMFKFRFAPEQVSVQLEPGGRRGRAMVDGVMSLEALAPLFTYPLRTILVYRFTLDQAGAPQVYSHEEMWSFGDMIAALPLLGRFYSETFRPAFSRGFLLASRVCRWRHA